MLQTGKTAIEPLQLKHRTKTKTRRLRTMIKLSTMVKKETFTMGQVNDILDKYLSDVAYHFECLNYYPAKSINQQDHVRNIAILYNHIACFMVSQNLKTYVDPHNNTATLDPYMEGCIPQVKIVLN